MALIGKIAGIGDMVDPEPGGGGGGGGSAQEGLGQVQQGSGVIKGALNTAAGALGVGGVGGDTGYILKKGGSVKKNYTKSGKINLAAGGISTAQKNSKCSNW